MSAEGSSRTSDCIIKNMRHLPLWQHLDHNTLLAEEIMEIQVLIMSRQELATQEAVHLVKSLTFMGILRPHL